MFRRNLILRCAMACVLLMGCSNPRNYSIPSDVKDLASDKGFQGALEKLPTDDRRALGAYLVRAAVSEVFAGTKAPAKTIGEAIQSEHEREAEQTAKEAAVKALAEKVQAERAVAQKALDDSVTVAVTKKTFVPADPMARRYKGSVDFSMAFENKTANDIKGVKGTVKFSDMFGDKIRAINFSVDDPIAAGKTMLWEGSVDYNQFMADSQKLAQTPLEKMKVEWMPDTILFADGSALKMPGATESEP